MEVKKHFKLFKAGKNWCVMAIAVAALATGTAMSTTAHADTTPSTQGTTMVQTLASTAYVQSTDNQSVANTNASAQPANDTPAAPAANEPARQIDYQTTVNAGKLGQTTADQGNVVFNGWHATNQYQQGMHHFVIALDGSNNRELYRSEVKSVPSSAAGQAYPKAPISTAGGFSFAMPADKLNSASSLRLVSRYTRQADGNPAGGVDYWYPSVATKAGYLDQFKIVGNNIIVSGWHADDMAAKYQTHYLILIDQTTGKEIARQIVTNDHSSDVANAGYNTIANAQDARFSAKFTLQPSMLGHSFRLISRYSTPELANTQYSDYDYANTLHLGNQQAAWLDNFSVDGAHDQIEVSGWHAADGSAAYPTHFLILYDQTKNREVAHQVVENLASPDVAKAEGQIANSSNARFSASFKVTPEMAGDQFVLVSRYSDSTDGKSYGHYIDHWYGTKLSLKQNQAYLDNFKVNGTKINVSGWHIDDQSLSHPNHYLIMFDRTKNREVARQKVTDVASPDIAQNSNLGTALNAANARFSATFNIEPGMLGDYFVLISRYSDAANGEGNYSQNWLSNKSLQINHRQAGYLDNFKVVGNKIVASGWHADDASTVASTHFIVLFDQTKNREVAYQVVENQASPDVAKAEGQIANAGNSRFSTSFTITPEMAGDQLVLISRYSDSTDGKRFGSYSDYRYGNKIDLNQNQAYLDNFNVNGTKINVSGWHIDDLSFSHPYHYLILFDQTKNHEVARQKVTDLASPDIAQNSKLGTALNAANARFSATFNVEPGMLGDHFVLISRYSDAANGGEGNYSQNWIGNKSLQINHQQAGYLDNFKIAGKNIVISGWHADDASAVAPTHFIILFDKTKGREVGHQVVKLTASPDVARAEGQIANAGNARFSTSFALTPAMIGDQFVVISRYSNSTDDSNYGSSYSDYWYGNQLNLNQNQAWLDNFSQSGNRIEVSGWHADDYSMTEPYHYLILWDLTDGKEVGRQRVDTTASPDITRVHGDIINADRARFRASFNVPGNIRNHAFQIISRYSDAATGGEGYHSDNWISNRYLNIYQNPGWMYQINYSQIQPTGPVGHNIGPGYEGIKTWLIKRRLGTDNIHNQYTYYDASLVKDVQRQHGLPQTGWVDFNTWKVLGLQPNLWTAIDSYVAPLAVRPGQGRQAHIEAMINQAYRYMNQPWLAGCSSMPGYGVDCSGLVMQCLYAAGIKPTSCSSIYHGFPGNEWNSRQLFTDPHFMNVSWQNKQRGDLVFYYEPGTHVIIHVAIYLGNGNVIESWPPRVMVQPIQNGQRYVIAGIRRVFA